MLKLPPTTILLSPVDLRRLEHKQRYRRKPAEHLTARCDAGFSEHVAGLIEADDNETTTMSLAPEACTNMQTSARLGISRDLHLDIGVDISDTANFPNDRSCELDHQRKMLPLARPD